MEAFCSEKFPEVKIYHSRRFCDNRGFFGETYRKNHLGDLPEFVQENHSRSEVGVFRGLHYQLPPKAQGKLVYCASGVIEDYVVDIRRDSPTFGQWKSFVLDALGELWKMVYVPPGFAHGFRALRESHVIYKVTDYWSPEHERCIRWDDPDIKLGLLESDTLPLIISNKDSQAPFLKNAETF